MLKLGLNGVSFCRIFYLDSIQFALDKSVFPNKYKFSHLYNLFPFVSNTDPPVMSTTVVCYTWSWNGSHLVLSTQGVWLDVLLSDWEDVWMQLCESIRRRVLPRHLGSSFMKLASFCKFGCYASYTVIWTTGSIPHVYICSLINRFGLKWER